MTIPPPGSIEATQSAGSAGPAGTGSAPTEAPIYGSGVPLGGLGPSTDSPPEKSTRRHLILAMLLFIAAVGAGKASTMPWRDYMWSNPNTVVETGWAQESGKVGMGWITMILAMCIATSGLLIITLKERFGRVLAVSSGAALMCLATLEWGVGGAGSRNGPGIGLWIQLLVGAAVILVVGMISPTTSKDPASRDR